MLGRDFSLGAPVVFLFEVLLSHTSYLADDIDSLDAHSILQQTVLPPEEHHSLPYQGYQFSVVGSLMKALSLPLLFQFQT